MDIPEQDDKTHKEEFWEPCEDEMDQLPYDDGEAEDEDYAEDDTFIGEDDDI
jgi:hypothetical protein